MRLATKQMKKHRRHYHACKMKVEKGGRVMTMFGSTIECEGCKETVYVSGRTIKERRENAKKKDWVYQMGTLALPTEKFDKGDFCPACVAEFGNGKVKK